MRAAGLIVLGMLVTGCGGLGLHPTRAHQAEEWVERADALRRTGDYAGAQATYRQTLASDAAPGIAARAVLGLARLYTEPGNPEHDYRQAYEQFDRLLREYPQSPWTEEARAWQAVLVALFAQQDQLTQSRALFGVARLHTEPGNPEHDYRQAYEQLERVLRGYPQSPWAEEARAWRAVLATLFAQQDQLTQSRRDAERLRQEVQRARQDVQRIRRDLDRLKQRELELERQRSP